MKVALSGLAFVLVMAAGTGAHARTAPVCLTASKIAGTSVVSDRAILFHMDDGSVWRNTLRRPCPGLAFEQAFSEEVRGGEICSNQQTIRVPRRGGWCFLGAFTLDRPRPRRAPN